MYKGTIATSTSLTSGTDIPYGTILNTNDNTIADNGVVTIKATGYYNIQGSVTITGYTVSVPITIQLYCDGVAIPESISSVVAGDTNTNAITLTTPSVPIAIKFAQTGNAKISVRISGSATASSGVFSVEKLR